MKTILYLMIALFMSANFASCTPTSINDTEKAPQACCDEEGDIPPVVNGGG